MGGISKFSGFAAIAGAFAAINPPAQAADLGGNCCADLEERIVTVLAWAGLLGSVTLLTVLTLPA